MGLRAARRMAHLIHAVFWHGHRRGHGGHESLHRARVRPYMRRRLADRLAEAFTQPQEALALASRLAIAGAVDLVCGGRGALARARTCDIPPPPPPPPPMSYLLAYTREKTHRVGGRLCGVFPGAITTDDGWVAARGSVDRGAWLSWEYCFFGSVRSMQFAWMTAEITLARAI